MQRARQTGLKRRRLRSPAARARDRQLAALRQWLRQRVAVLSVAFVLLAPFGLIAGVSGIRVALGAAPTLTQGAATLTYNENDVVIIDSAIVVTDDPPLIESRIITAEFLGAGLPNNPNTAFMRVQTGTGPVTVTGPSLGQFTVLHAGTPIATYPATGVGSGINASQLNITLGSAGTIDQTMVQDLMRAIAYGDTSEDPVEPTGPNFRQVRLTIVGDSEGDSNPLTYSINNVVQVNDAPTITRPPETIDVNDDTDLTIDAPAASVPISIEDLDSGSNAIVTVLSVPSGQGTLTMSAVGGCAVGGSGTATVTLTATESAADACLATLTYRSPPAFSGLVTLTIDVDDNGFTVAGAQNPGLEETAQSTVTINVSSVNAPPVLTVPGGQSVLQFQPLSIPAIGLADADALAADMTVTLTVTKGVLAIGVQTGLTSITGDGTGSVTMVGSRAELDASLDSITYTSTAASGNLNDVLTIVVDDLGNTGSGGAQSDTETIAITVNEANDAPVITAPASASVSEDVLSPVTGISIADTDANPSVDPVLMTMSVNSGTLTMTTLTGLSFNTGDGSGDASMQFTGTIDNINAALATLTYLTAPNSTASATLTLDLNDQGFTGAPGPQNAAQKQVTLNVAGANDGPTITVPGAQPLAEDAPLTFSSGGGNLISVADVDSGANPIRVSLGVASGTLTLSGVSGLSFPSGANGASSMTVEGTLANINTALNGLVYQPTLNFTGSDTLSVGANDQGNTGSGSPGLDSKTVTINISAVNDAPVVTAPASVGVTEDIAAPISGVSVSDADAGGANILMTFSASSGTVTLTNTTGLSVAGGANGSSSVTFSGTIAAFNAVLNTLTYQTNLNSTAGDTLVITANDDGNTGSGGPKSDTKNVTITVGAVNDGPTITLPAPSYSIAEEAPLTINGTGIQVADPDVGGLDVEVTLTAAHGTLTLDPGANTAPPLTSVSGNGTGSVTLRGSLANVNNALSPLVYQGATDYVGPDTINIGVTDLGNTGSGGPVSDTESIGITVTAVNDAPVVTAPASIGVTEDVGASIPGISVSDVDAGSASILMSFSAGTGTITFGNTAGLTLAGGANGTSSVSYSGTMSALNAAISTLTYLNAPNSTTSDALTVVANDQGNTGVGGALSDTEVVVITVASVNDAPNIIVPGLQSGTEDIQLDIIGLSITDIDAASNDIRVTLTAGFGTLTVSPTGSLAFDAGDGTSDQTMTFRGTLANVNTALGNLKYQGLLHYNGNDTIQVVVDDLGSTGSGGPKTDTDTVLVFLTGDNDAPTLTLPSPQAVTEDVDSPISGVSVADPDVSTTQIKITLSVTSGTLTLGTMTGLTFDSGSDGTTDASMAFTGSMTNVNAALASISYRGNQDFDATDTLSVTANDLGNVGSGGPKSASGAIIINVAGQNDGPEISLPPAQNAQEDTNHTINGVGISINDVDVGGGQIQVQLSVSNGVLSLSTLAGLTIDAPADGVQDASMTFRGTLSQVNAALQNMVYRGNVNFNGSDPLTIIVGDLGNTGAGGPKMDTDVLQITVGDINDAPVVSVPGGQSVNEDTNLSIMGISVADPDIASSPMRITISAANGTITLGSTTGLTFITGDGTADPTIIFTGTLGNVNGALSAILYRGNQDFNGTDTITVIANDQGATGLGGALQDTKTISVSVAPIDDAPVITLPGPVQTANSPAAVLVDAQATVVDVDSPNLDTGALTVQIVANADAGDRLNVRHEGSGAGQIGVAGNTISFGGVPIGTYGGEVTQSTQMVVTLNASATPAAVQALVRNLAFRIVDAEPTPAVKTVRLVLTDGDGETSSPADKAVRVAPSADLSVRFEDPPGTLGGVAEFAYKILVTNHGPLTATGVQVVDRLPSGISFLNVETSKGSCSNGQTVTCQLGSVTVGQTVRIVIRVATQATNTFDNTVVVTSTSDDPNPGNNSATVSVWVAGENSPGDEKKDDEDRRAKLTEERRQQRQRTNQHGLDDYRTEGNVVLVNLLASEPYAIVAMRDGPQRIMLPCKDGCPDVRVGDYLEADGVKENEQLFYAENVSLTRGGKKVK